MPATPRDSLLVTLLTAPGRGALAVVGLTGRDAARAIDVAFAARGGRPVAARDDGGIAVGGWRATGEEVVVVRRRSDLLEVHCHGGFAAAAAVIASLVAGGATATAWPTWLAAAGESATIVEAHEALALAAGPQAARILARQAAGALDAEIARLAAARAAGDRRGAEAGCVRLARASRVGLRLTRPWRVVVVGPVNAGKSSLVNALAGHSRSIVTPEPGTTRDLVEARIVLGGWEVDVIDTAGSREAGATADEVERAGMTRAAAAAAAADLVVRVAPAHQRPAAAAPGDLLVASQIDRHPLAAGWPDTAVPTSATSGAGIADLCAAIVDRLVPEDRTEPGLLAGPVPFTPRQVAEIVRLSLD